MLHRYHYIWLSPCFDAADSTHAGSWLEEGFVGCSEDSQAGLGQGLETPHDLQVPHRAAVPEHRQTDRGGVI